jgi:hypothetical protein
MCRTLLPTKKIGRKNLFSACGDCLWFKRECVCAQKNKCQRHDVCVCVRAREAFASTAVTVSDSKQNMKKQKYPNVLFQKTQMCEDDFVYSEATGNSKQASLPVNFLYTVVKVSSLCSTLVRFLGSRYTCHVGPRLSVSPTLHSLQKPLQPPSPSRGARKYYTNNVHINQNTAYPIRLPHH